ncbi:MAG: Type 1 glutamine amidotransferase-like domain-containing protein [Candidatus Aminicenantes bacterium]|nr:Type 1 glutamine amidotransferase-like domain-containing protein [Candidatus Aminicenantes bacterium]
MKFNKLSGADPEGESSAMRGHILLEGGAEFGGQMAAADMRAIELAGGLDARVCIIPAAAAPDNNHQQAGHNGVRWFKYLGARQATLLPLIDHTSANQYSIATSLRNSRLIYLLGGFPHYLEQTLAGSLSWQAIIEAYQAGAVIAGSSAGAMVLCQHYYNLGTGSVIDGLNLIPKACIIPHHNTSGKDWGPHLVALLPEDVIIGIDEQTGMIDDGADGKWNIYGKGFVARYKDGKVESYHPGETFSL